MATSKKKAQAAGKILKSSGRVKSIAASDVGQAKRIARQGVGRSVINPAGRRSSGRSVYQVPSSAGRDFALGEEGPAPETVAEETIARLVVEAEEGIPTEKLRRRGRPAIGGEAASTYSVRLPDDLVILADQRSEIDRVSRGETIRRALIEYLTK